MRRRRPHGAHLPNAALTTGALCLLPLDCPFLGSCEAHPGGPLSAEPVQQHRTLVRSVGGSIIVDAVAEAFPSTCAVAASYHVVD